MSDHPRNGDHEMSAKDGTPIHPDSPKDREPSFALFALLARQAEIAERTAGGFSKQRQALLKEHADNPVVLSGVWRLEESEYAAQALAHQLKVGEGRGERKKPGLKDYCPDPRVVAFVEETKGLADASFFFLGLLPQWIALFETVGKLWAYCGLHVKDGRAPRMGDLKGGGKPGSGDWSPLLKAVAIKRLAEPCMKGDGPYRPVYTMGKASRLPMWEGEGPSETLLHPDCPTCVKATEGGKNGDVKKGSCRALGGEHWAAWHLHKHALRVTAKAILKDLWRVSRGHEPLYGGVDPLGPDTLTISEHPTA
jgi:hypothetical protein